MKRLVYAVSLLAASLFAITGCVTNDDPFPVHPAETPDPDAPVAGAETPPRESSDAGWKW